MSVEGGSIPRCEYHSMPQREHVAPAVPIGKGQGSETFLRSTACKRGTFPVTMAANAGVNTPAYAVKQAKGWPFMTVAEQSAGAKAPYLRHFGLLENPFRITPNPRFTWSTASMIEALGHTRNVIDERLGCACVSGYVGTGKTTLSQVIAEDAAAEGHAVASLYRVPGDTKQTEAKIYAAIAEELNLPKASGRSAEKTLRAIQDHAIKKFSEGKTLVVLIDDAHRLRGPGFAALKSLLNLQDADAHLVQVVLFGQLPEMVDVLKTDVAIHSRLAAHTTLNPLTRDDVESMLVHRIRQAGRTSTFFSSAAVDALHRHSKGIPRFVCTMAHEATVYAFEATPRPQIIDESYAVRGAQAVLKAEQDSAE